ncbi:MAG: PEP-CTERM sorting domain-containing protein [Verrucomicrobiota bacterium]
MRTNLFAQSLPRLQVLCFLVFLVACGSVRAQSFYDYSYSVTRFQDQVTGYMVSEIANYCGSDLFGNPLFTNALPVYAGLNPDPANPIWLDSGFSLQITRLPAGAVVVGIPQALPIGGGGGPQHISFHAQRQKNKHNGTLKITEVGVGTRARFLPNGGRWGPPEDVHVNDTFSNGCVMFDGPVKWTGCDVDLEPLAGGEFSSVYAILGGGVNWPNSSVPSFYEDKEWDFVYIGDSDSPFNGSGFGMADVQCNVDEFMSVATPELYVGCVPEPSSLSLICIGALSLLARRHLKQK